MRYVQYEWDDEKAALNLRKHGVDFLDAIAALEDPNRAEEIDAQFDYGEDPCHRNRSRNSVVRGRDISRRRHVQNHICAEGHTT
jgi:uncharacterized DUF497 family protein